MGTRGNATQTGEGPLPTVHQAKQSRKTNAQQHASDDHASWLIAQHNLRKL
jgi:hypothetical protein